MMNLEVKADHNMFGSSGERSRRLPEVNVSPRRRSEGGYALVALLALMSVVALFAMAVAPSMQQQTQRDREQEAIFRGEQVADAIVQYYRYRASTTGNFGDQALPTSMDQLLEGIPVVGGSKNRQVLRVSAARDPLTGGGEWRMIHPRTQRLIDFQQSVLFYTGGFLPPPRSAEVQRLQALAVPVIVNAINTGTKPAPSTGSSIDDDSSGPFVGVASRSTKNSVLAYYGIERHDQWIFTPLFRN
jgi:type II secretory pathway pseudopilin PulG